MRVSKLAAGMALAAIWIGPAVAQTWSQTTQNADSTETYFIDTASITRSGDIAHVWVRIDFATPQVDEDSSKTYTRTLSHWTYDCAKSQARDDSITDTDADGAVIWSSTAKGADADWSPTLPGTIGQALMNAACAAASAGATPAETPAPAPGPTETQASDQPPAVAQASAAKPALPIGPDSTGEWRLAGKDDHDEYYVAVASVSKTPTDHVYSYISKLAPLDDTAADAQTQFSLVLIDCKLKVFGLVTTDSYDAKMSFVGSETTSDSDFKPSPITESSIADAERAIVCGAEGEG
ncbi:MAG TPA: surface-adhesin E family protein [Caulobacteraceae bacterium]|jgi:hypothetical protein